MENLRVGSKQLIKDLNRSRVIEQIRSHSPISRTDISKRTDLGLSTVTNITEELLQQELIYEVGSANSTGGRKPVLLQFNYEFAFTIGIKVEEYQLILAITDLKGTIFEKREMNFNKKEGPAKIQDLMIDLTRNLINESDISSNKILGIGIAVSGLVNSRLGRVVRSSLLEWEQVDIKGKIESEFKIPVFIDNDVNAYTLAELWLGYGKTHEDFICVSIGTGIGAGIVIDRKIHYGKLGGAGEFGHTIIQVQGYLCHCGQKGCLEMYASEKFLKREGEILKDQFPKTLLEESDFSFEEVNGAACQKDPLATELFRRLGEYLGVGLINMINSLNPSTIIFVGEGMMARSFFLPYAKEIAKQNFFSKANFETEFHVSSLGNDAWLSGAALLAISQLFQAPIYEQSFQLI